MSHLALIHSSSVLLMFSFFHLPFTGLVLVPTRELALQVSAVLKDLGKHLKLRVMVCTGGTVLRDDILRLQDTVHIVVGTPGRIRDLAQRGVAKLAKVSHIIMDEADKLLSIEFQPMIEDCMSFCAKDPQIMLFSATFPVTVKQFMQKHIPNPHQINLMEELTLKVRTLPPSFANGPVKSRLPFLLPP